MNTWLYRAAGTVGIAGGFLLLAAGSAQAAATSDTNHARAGGIGGLLGEVLSPTAGLLPLELTSTADRPDLSTLRLNPADGRYDQPIADPELLPGPGGVPSLPTGLDRVLDPVPLDPVGIPGGQAGIDLPVDRVLDTDGDLAGLPLDQGPRTLPAPGLPLAGDLAAVDPADLLPDLPAGVSPADLTGVSPADLANPADLADLRVGGLGTADPLDLTAAVTGEPLPALLAEQVAYDGLYPTDLLNDDRTELTDSLPVGPALAPLGQLVGVGNLPAQVPLAGSVLGPAFAGLPMVPDQRAGAPATGEPAGSAAPAAAGHADDRPVAGEDPELGAW